jgi:hypothetical protein
MIFKGKPSVVGHRGFGAPVLVGNADIRKVIL